MGYKNTFTLSNGPSQHLATLHSNQIDGVKMLAGGGDNAFKQKIEGIVKLLAHRTKL